jgi:DNA-binding transcriptional ArsR family regulator
VRGGELAAGEIASHFEATQQAVSHHLQVLAKAGLLSERRDGVRRLYALDPQGLDPVREIAVRAMALGAGAVEVRRRAGSEGDRYAEGRGVPGKDSLPPGSTTVEIGLTADGPDTIVELFHHDLPAEETDGHLKGWMAMLDRLAGLRR